MHQQTGLLRCAIASLGFIAAVACQPTSASAQDLPALPKAIKDAGVIRIGVKCDSPPFGSSGPDGKPLGVEVEMAKQIGTARLRLAGQGGAQLRRHRCAHSLPDKRQDRPDHRDSRQDAAAGTGDRLLRHLLLGEQQCHRAEGEPGPEAGRPRRQVDPDRQGRVAAQVAEGSHPRHPVRAAQHECRQPPGPPVRGGRTATWATP